MTGQIIAEALSLLFLLSKYPVLVFVLFTMVLFSKILISQILKMPHGHRYTPSETQPQKTIIETASKIGYRVWKK